MSTTTRVNPVGRALSDAGVLAWRSLKRIPRTPDMLIYATIQPIMFVLLFAYVFGNAIPIPGFPGARAYREFLMSGIFAQTMAFAVASASVGLADDMSKGLIDRFRSLPMARSGVIAGRVIGDLVFNAFVMVVMVICGFIVGWRWHNGFAQALAAFAILLLFAFAMLWVGALIGLSVGSAEVAASAGLIWLFPLTFLSNAFVPTPNLPSGLQPVAEWNPISAIVAACRHLFGNPSPFASPTGFPAQHPVLLSLLWCLVIIAVFAPLAVRKYRHATTR
ncbi:ABC transporter permease [Kribbella sandramycini]|uniref:Transport permease protein n=1 Tax=Kribbella sandramycini TaxID=60450 RepID=A0A7Y4L4A5_9ACTN|nr:ABC transporter permease [Kribbella sandramycini]MBB6571490.1 ABC transporter DrrB family efflux protein [Kribbella sandramycini]NOL44139.1 ABC transporter permease [Kribbella sandramycini]